MGQNSKKYLNQRPDATQDDEDYSDEANVTKGLPEESFREYEARMNEFEVITSRLLLSQYRGELIYAHKNGKLEDYIMINLPVIFPGEDDCDYLSVASSQREEAASHHEKSLHQLDNSSVEILKPESATASVFATAAVASKSKPHEEEAPDLEAAQEESSSPDTFRNRY